MGPIGYGLCMIVVALDGLFVVYQIAKSRGLIEVVR